MSNIAGKAYAMNTISPIKWYRVWINKFIFWLAGTSFFKPRLAGLETLSLIHYARWVILRPGDFPRLAESQPKENLSYGYELFFSNFNGSWAQYIDSFSSAIPSGLDLLWYRNVKYPNSVPFTPFHEYITYNQLWTSYYYNAYPLATANDVKSARRVKTKLLDFIDKSPGATSPEEFQAMYNRLLLSLQHDLSQMAPTPIVSLADQAIGERVRLQSQVASQTPAVGS